MSITKKYYKTIVILLVSFCTVIPSYYMAWESVKTHREIDEIINYLEQETIRINKKMYQTD